VPPLSWDDGVCDSAYGTRAVVRAYRRGNAQISLALPNNQAVQRAIDSIADFIADFIAEDRWTRSRPAGVRMALRWDTRTSVRCGCLQQLHTSPGGPPYVKIIPVVSPVTNLHGQYT
jgi:hypothetical protein